MAAEEEALTEVVVDVVVVLRSAASVLSRANNPQTERRTLALRLVLLHAPYRACVRRCGLRGLRGLRISRILSGERTSLGEDGNGR